MEFNLKRNSAWAVIEVIVSGISLFFLYKFIVMWIGVKALGVWSLVLATTSLARLGDLGAAAGLSRYVAIAVAKKEYFRARTYMWTAVVINSLLYLAFGTILYYPLWLGLHYVVPAADLGTARALLPYTIASFVLMNINSVMQSALIGVQRSDLKSMVVVGSLFVQIAITAAAVPHFGLVGMAWGQLGQYLVASAVIWHLFLKRTDVRRKKYSKLCVSRTAGSDLIGFGVRLQALNIINFVFEPTFKLVMSSVCGLEALGIFEMSYRMLLQVRQIVVSPTQALIPAFAHLRTMTPDAVADLYRKAMATMIVVGAPLLLSVGVLSPLISLLWIGRYDHMFVLFSLIGSLGWIANMAASPSYSLAVSAGIVRWNIVGCIMSSFVGPALAYVCGRLFGPVGVVSAAMFGLLLNAIVIIYFNGRMFGVPVLPNFSALRRAVIGLLNTAKTALT